MRVEEVMSRHVKVCLATDTLNRAAELMWDYDCGFLPVVRDHASRVLTGANTDRDIAMAAYTRGEALSAIPVSVAMARGVKVCHPGDDISTAAALMRLKQVRRLPVVDSDHRLVGIISINDIARLSQSEGPRRERISTADVAQTLAAISRPRAKHGLSVDRDYIE
jgi:CBS domain-containing protein